MKKCLFIIMLFTLILSSLYGNTMNYIHLKDGRVISGQAVRRGNVVTISGLQGLYQFYTADIEKIDGEVLVRPDTEQELKEMLGEEDLLLDAMEVPEQITEEETDMTRETEADKSVDNPIAVIETNMGNLEVELFAGRAPKTTENFISLIEKEYYDGLIFHRIIEDFMIQGGCPDGTGRGGPGYTIDCEIHPDLKHDRKGLLSMANAGPNTGGSQFFITLVPTPWLDGRHAVFGQVITGLDVVEAIGVVETGDQDRPVQDVIMKKVYIK